METLESTNQEKLMFGHPRGLFVLFFSEMWERFCYYGMRGLLTVYLIDVFLKGDKEAFAIYGTYTALVYMAPVLGGKIADKFLGYKNAVLLGGLMMACGEFMLLGKSNFWLYLGMAGIIVGNGYFKANISSIVGKLYKEGDSRRDSGFTIFYIGINIGALLATLVCVEVGRKLGYEYGFALAGTGMIIGTLTFLFGKKHYEYAAQAPNPEKLHSKVLGPFTLFHLIVLGSFALVPIIFMLIQYNSIMPYLLAVVGIYVVASLLLSAIKEGRIWRDRMIAMILIIIFNIAFWACFEQAGTSLTLFARRNVDRLIGGWEMSDATTQSFNPFYIILFGSIFSFMWIKLQERKINPSIAMKFGLGIIQLGLGYLIVLVGGMFLSDAYLVPLWTLAFLYLLHTTGELFLSPIGLSMVTKLAPQKITGTAMGGWFLSFAFANYAAAIIAMATGSEEHGGNSGPTKELTYSEQIEAIKTNVLQLEKSCGELSESSKLLIDNSSFNTEDPNDQKIPGELNKVVDQIYPTFSQIHSEIFPLLNDTSSYTGKQLLWKQLVVNYKNTTDNLLASVNGINDCNDKIGNGATFLDVKNDFSNGIIGMGDGLNSSYSKFIEIVDRINSGNNLYDKNNAEYLFKNSVDAMENFDNSYGTIASHIYWNTYSKVYTFMGLITIAIGIFLCFISKPLTKLMHGVE